MTFFFYTPRKQVFWSFLGVKKATSGMKLVNILKQIFSCWIHQEPRWNEVETKTYTKNLSIMRASHQKLSQSTQNTEAIKHNVPSNITIVMMKSE